MPKQIDHRKIAVAEGESATKKVLKMSFNLSLTERQQLEDLMRRLTLHGLTTGAEARFTLTDVIILAVTEYGKLLKSVSGV